MIVTNFVGQMFSAFNDTTVHLQEIEKLIQKAEPTFTQTVNLVWLFKILT